MACLSLQSCFLPAQTFKKNAKKAECMSIRMRHSFGQSSGLMVHSESFAQKRRLRQISIKSGPIDLGFELNPQNVPPPKIVPSTSFSPKEVVEIQLNALKDNDEPLQNHGIQTMYEFANNVGSLDASMYFGYRKDLYHFDHFLGIFWTKLGNLVNLSSYQITEVSPVSNGLCKVKVTVEGSKEASPYVFTLKQKELGRLKGSWLTEMIVVEEKQ